MDLTSDSFLTEQVDDTASEHNSTFSFSLSEQGGPPEDEDGPLLIDPEELPFYMALIEQFNANVREKLKKLG